MNHPTQIDQHSQELSYATGASRRRFSFKAFFAGALLPYGYVLAAFIVIGLLTPRRSPIEAFYSLEPQVLVAIALFPALVWLIWWRTPERGFLAGVLTGTFALPVLAIIAIGISFRTGR
jgi:hypothetical protein